MIIDYALGGGDQAAVDRLIGDESWCKSGHPKYSGNVARIMMLGSFKIKVMVCNRETRREVLDLLGK